MFMLLFCMSGQILEFVFYVCDTALNAAQRLFVTFSTLSVIRVNRHAVTMVTST